MDEVDRLWSEQIVRMPKVCGRVVPKARYVMIVRVARWAQFFYGRFAN